MMMNIIIGNNQAAEKVKTNVLGNLAISIVLSRSSRKVSWWCSLLYIQAKKRYTVSVVALQTFSFFLFSYFSFFLSFRCSLLSFLFQFLTIFIYNFIFVIHYVHYSLFILLFLTSQTIIENATAVQNEYT